MDTVGNVLDVGHIGYGEDNTSELLDFYEKVLGLDHVKAYGLDHPYVGRINGVPDCIYDIGFAECTDDQRKMEFVGCVNATKGDARFAPGIEGHAHLIFETDNLEACYSRLSAAAVDFATEIMTVDYGRFSGHKAFTIFDINKVNIMIVESETPNARGQGYLSSMVGISYTIADINQCSRWFRDGLLLAPREIEVEGSQYLRACCGERYPPSRGAEILISADNRFAVELLEVTQKNPVEREVWVNSWGCLHLCVVVDDIFAVHERMSRQGAVFVGPPALVELGANKGARAIFTKLSDVILLELYQYKKTN